jgi:hypothetical protein
MQTVADHGNNKARPSYVQLYVHLPTQGHACRSLGHDINSLPDGHVSFCSSYLVVRVLIKIRTLDLVLSTKHHKRAHRNHQMPVLCLRDTIKIPALSLTLLATGWPQVHHTTPHKPNTITLVVTWWQGWIGT